MSKQIFKGKTLYTKTCVDNIIRVYKHADEAIKKSNWYRDARDFACVMGNLYGYDVMNVCGAIAALSPQKTWEANMELTEELLRTGKCGHTLKFQSKARDILDVHGFDSVARICDILNGNKITSFFLNIYDPKSQAVTIDRHAMDIALGAVHDGNRQMTANQYAFFANCYRAAAVEISEPPHHIQAVTWVHWRELKKVGAENSLSD